MEKHGIGIEQLCFSDSNTFHSFQIFECFASCDNNYSVSGTDATHAEHIETIKSRLYVGVRPDGKFVPGELGMGLVEGTC